MSDFPHHYVAVASGEQAGDVQLQSDALPVLRSAPPIEFGGPGNRWSPETLLTAAVADCFVLTFRSIARASGLEWASISCQVRGTLDRVDRAIRFTRFDTHVDLTLRHEGDCDLAHRVLQKAERGCLITNSLKAEVHLVADVRIGSNAACLAEA